LSSRVLFLDRDGIINVDHSYVSKIEDFQFSSAIFDLLNIFKQYGYLFYIVTNQSGIGRGYYTLNDFDILTSWMIEEFKSRDITIERVLYCPHDPSDNCNCRKPNIGMVEDLIDRCSIDLSKSWMIGDKSTDIEFATNAKIANSIYIGSDRDIDSTLSFGSIAECERYLVVNGSKLLL